MTPAAVTPRLRLRTVGWVDIVAMAASAALCLSLIVPAPSALRFVLAVIFVAVGPGTAILLLLGARGLARPELGLVIGVGVATTVLVSEALLWIGAFHPRPELAAAAGAVFATILLVHVRLRARTGSAAAAGGPADDAVEG
jgi:hypothetical protein